MLVLSRKKLERIRIGDSITVTVTRIKGQRVHLSIEAPREVTVKRAELAAKPEQDHDLGESGGAP